MRVSLLEALQAVEVAKLAANRRPAYVKELKRCIKNFITHTGDAPIDSVTPEQIECWLLTKGANAWSRSTHISRLSTLFEFAKRRRWLLINPCEYLERVSVDHPIPSVLAPEQARTIVDRCRERKPCVLAWLALALFAGLRPTEACGMTWGDIDFTSKRIIVKAGISKVRRHRIVEPPEACWRLLSEAKRLRCPLPVSLISVKRFQRIARADLGWSEWPQDVLRHTAASMWLAILPDAGRISMQLGNSAGVLLRHYHALTPRESAEKFWTI